MNYTTKPIIFKLKKVFRYIRLYGPVRTLAKVRGQYHMIKPIATVDLPKNLGKRSVAIIGCGNYSFNVIGYYLKRYRGDVIRAVLDIDESRAMNLSRILRANYYTSDYEKILEDDNVRLIYIASNHYSHADYAIRALKANKHVHIEKPHVVNFEQLNSLQSAMLESKAKIRLGFNRPSSRFGQKILEALNKEEGSAMINWFVAGHRIEPNHWYFDDKEGGRVLGNLCHWTDFVYHMIGGDSAFPVKIIPARHEKADCDIVVTFISCTGTIAAISFSAKGHTFEGVREKLNAHKGNTLITMSDYETLRIDVVDKKSVHKNVFRDHGHRNNILKSFDLLENEKGESHSYIYNTAKFFLETKKSLDSNEIITVNL